MEVFFELELNGFPLDITFPSSSDITIKKLREFIKVGAHETIVLDLNGELYPIETDQEMEQLKNGSKLKIVPKNSIKKKPSAFFKASTRHAVKPIELAPPIKKREDSRASQLIDYRFDVIDYTAINSSSGKKTFTAFRINFKNEDGTVSTMLKRYKQIEALHKEIASKIKNLPKLPPRAFLTILGKETSEELEKQKIQLDTYLKKLERIPNIFQLDCMKKFLSDASLSINTNRINFEERKKQEEKILLAEQEFQSKQEKRRSLRLDTLRKSLHAQEMLENKLEDIESQIDPNKKKSYRKTGATEEMKLATSGAPNSPSLPRSGPSKRPAPPPSLSLTLSQLQSQQTVGGAFISDSFDVEYAKDPTAEVMSLLDTLNTNQYEEARKKLLEEKRKLQAELEKIKREEEEERLEEEITKEVRATLEEAKKKELERKKKFQQEEPELERKEAEWREKRKKTRSPRVKKLLEEGKHPIFILPVDQDKLEEDEEEEVQGCAVCGKLDNLIHCVGVCGRSIHQACRTDGKPNDWICDDCEAAAQACIFCGETIDLLQCSGPSCERRAHRTCLSASDLVDGVWLCFDCVPT